MTPTAFGSSPQFERRSWYASLNSGIEFGGRPLMGGEGVGLSAAVRNYAFREVS